jgi:DNA-binding ferritin-like protein
MSIWPPANAWLRRQAKTALKRLLVFRRNFTTTGDSFKNPSIARDIVLDKLRLDNRKLVAFLRDAHLICVDYVDIGTASVLATLITEAEKRIWALTECMRSI